MIPQIIHYCWLSNDPFPPLVKKCIDSWQTHMPNYKFILWNTNQIDINSNLWLKQAFENKKYAFAADYIRFYALYYYGGIYLDADVEVFKSFDDLLYERQFLGEEAGGDIEAAVMGAEKGLDWVKECLDYYKERSFVDNKGNFDLTPVPLLVSKIISNKHISIRPYYYFSPKDFNVGKIDIKSETYCIHHFDGKWIKKGVKYKIKKTIHLLLYIILGRIGHNKLIHYLRK